jgi:DNA-binding transcriptional LysR family regulator
MTAQTQQLDWAEIQILLAFGTHQSLAAAAQDLKIDPTTLSRRLRQLERQLGLALIIHEGRSLRLTEAGQRVLAAAKDMQLVAERMVRQVAEIEPRAEGVVRLTALRSILQHMVMPALPAFRQTYPGIVLNLLADARNFAVGRQEADLAIRLAMPHGPDLAARKLFDVAYVRAGDPRLGWITYDEAWSTIPEAQWVAKNVPPGKIVLQANSLDLIREAVRAGVGQALLPIYLTENLPISETILTREAWLVLHNETRHTPRIRAVADWLVAESGKLLSGGARGRTAV